MSQVRFLLSPFVMTTRKNNQINSWTEPCKKCERGKKDNEKRRFDED